MLQHTANLDFNDAGISLLMIVAKSHLRAGNLTSALDYARRVMARKPNLETRVAVFELLSDVHFRGKNYDQAMAYKDSIVQANAQRNEIKNGKLFESSKVKFEIQNYRNELALNEAKMAGERRIFYTVLAILIAVAGFVMVMLRNRSLQHKQNKLIAQRNEQLLALALEKEKNDNLLLEKQMVQKESQALLEQERLKSELEARNRKLSAKALYLSGRNQMIEEVLSDLTQRPELSTALRFTH